MNSLNRACVWLKDAECGPLLDRPMGSELREHCMVIDSLVPSSSVRMYVRLHVRLWRRCVCVCACVPTNVCLCAHVYLW